ncbi:MAG TPA: Arm DNA-binding domain-containing protein [Puia sp.]|nr:Arm DNA-binding domain-containing protein [Puia sp.]
MSKSLSLLVHLKRQKKDPHGKMFLYVRVTIDGDNADFALSRRILHGEWSQSKQKCISKTQEALQLNAKIAKTKGDLTALFDRIEGFLQQSRVWMDDHVLIFSNTKFLNE